MSDEVKATETTQEVAAAVEAPAPAVAEEVAPPVPTEAPPAEEDKPQEETPAAAAAEAPAQPEEKKEKKSGSVARRFTFTKKWGKHRDEPAKEPEEPKDPKEDVLGWIAQQIPAAVHKANYQVLEWAQNTAVEEEADRKPIPGKEQSTTRNQFLAFLRDGDLLVKLANKLQAGAIEPATLEENADAAAQKEAQKKNIESFAQWASSAIGVENGLKSEDLLEKGKNGYSAVFQTLWQLGIQAKEKFDKDGFDVEAIKSIASQVVKSGLLTTILGFFRRNRQQAVEEQKEEGEAVAPAASAEGEASGEAAVEEPVAVKVETSAPAAVAAN